ncbi:MAG: cation:proton antiporter, partial [Actinomycetota bacterium]|nr:cation:proton antiporter [Actinomycetota bacterium]
MLLLFMAGLEIDLTTMRRMGMASLVVAIFGVAVPMAAGTLIFRAAGESLRSAVFIGGIMTATSIGLTLRSLMDMGKFRTREGTTVVTAAVIDDVIGIFILTVLVSVVTVGEFPSTLHVLRLLGLMTLFFAAVISLGFWGSKWLTRLVSRMWVDEAMVAISICFAIALGWMASSVKVAEITGAFLAGLVLNPTREKKAIAERLNTIGYGFFIPLFFTYIGVNMKLGALREAGIMSILFLLIAILGKIVGCGLGARPWFSNRSSLAIGVGMIPRAEVALIMATIGLQAGAIGNKVFAMTVLMVFVTNLLTPLLLKLAFRRVGERESAEAGRGH